MRWCRWVALAAIVVSCGRDVSQSRAPEPAGATAQPVPRQGDQSALAFSAGAHDRDSSAAERAATSNGAPAADQRVSLIGCLQGSDAPTAASGSGASTTSTVAQGAAGAPGPGAMRFTLIRARPEPGVAGVGVNGAGGSGGPLISGVADYRLQGDPNALRGHLNQDVRITARIDARQTVAEPRTRTGVNATASGAATASSAGSASGSTTAPRAIPDADATRPSAGADNMRLLVVEAIDMISPACARP
jgi:hypothetical protein